MSDHINQYHLHKDEDSKLHFEIKDARTHIVKHFQHVYKSHRHTFYQIIWFIESGYHYVDYQLHKHPANSVFLLNKGQVHHFCDRSVNNATLFHFDEIFLLRGNESINNRIQYTLFSEIGVPFLILDGDTISILETITPLLQAEIKERKYGYREIIFSLLQTIILKIERLKNSSAKQVEKLDGDLDIAMQFKRLIEKNMDEFLSLQQYANLLNVNTKKLSSASKKYLFTTPSQAISERKILEAKRMLSNYNISIKEVAFALGFDQATYFTKYFKKHTNLTPKEFKSQLT